ncbi:MAG: SRPBCC family protein [Gemmatimonas sp.]
MNEEAEAAAARAVTAHRTIAAPRERVFDAWLDANTFATWMVPPGIRASTARIDARVLGAYELTMHGDGNALMHSGVYREIDPPRRIIFTWISLGTHFRESVVTVAFAVNGAATDVVVTHDGLPDAGAEVAHRDGWTAVLERLDELITTNA